MLSEQPLKDVVLKPSQYFDRIEEVLQQVAKIFNQDQEMACIERRVQPKDRKLAIDAITLLFMAEVGRMCFGVAAVS